MRFDFASFFNIYFYLLKVLYREAKKFKHCGTVLFPGSSGMLIGYFQGSKLCLKINFTHRIRSVRS